MNNDCHFYLNCDKYNYNRSCLTHKNKKIKHHCKINVFIHQSEYKLKRKLKKLRPESKIVKFA